MFTKRHSLSGRSKSPPLRRSRRIALEHIQNAGRPCSKSDDGPQCYVCLRGEEAGVLIKPCRCTSKIHLGCLDDIRNKTDNPDNRTKCFICKFEYQFKTGQTYWQKKIKIILLFNILLCISLFINVIIYAFIIGISYTIFQSLPINIKEFIIYIYNLIHRGIIVNLINDGMMTLLLRVNNISRYLLKYKKIIISILNFICVHYYDILIKDSNIEWGAYYSSIIVFCGLCGFCLLVSTHQTYLKLELYIADLIKISTNDIIYE